MHKPQSLCMKCLTRAHLETVAHKLAILAKIGSLQNLITAIHVIIEQDMPDMLHMHSDLMRTTGFKITLHKSHIAETLKHPVMGYCMFANTIIGRDTHL